MSGRLFKGRNFNEKQKADNGNRTRLPSLGSWYSTNELYLHFLHYIISERKCNIFLTQISLANWGEMVYSCIKSGGKWWKVSRSGGNEPLRPLPETAHGSW